MNLPNSITLARIVAIPLLMWLLLGSPAASHNGWAEALAAAIFVIISLGGALDSQLALRRNQSTALGALLHPLAAELIIAGSFVALVEFSPVLVPSCVAVIVVGREFLVTGLRAIAAQEGFVFRTSDLGRVKIAAQSLAVPAVILARPWPAPVLFGLRIPLQGIALGALWMTVALSLYSAGDYFHAFWTKASRASEPGAGRQSFVLRRRAKQPKLTQEAHGAGR